MKRKDCNIMKTRNENLDRIDSWEKREASPSHKS